MEKTCFKCNETKPLTEFYAHPAMADGHLGKCKACTRKDANEHRQANLEKVREYDRNRPNAPARMVQRKKAAKLKPEAGNRAKRAWVERNPQKRAAQVAVANAMRNGELSRQTRCSRCTTVGPTEAHHPDYSQPLHVLWLCDRCHKEVHKEERAVKRSGVTA